MKTFVTDRIVNADESTGPSEIVVEDGIIADVRPSRGTDHHTCAVPGFIDMHTHGGGGADVMDDDPQRFSRIAEFHLRHGTTSFLGSTATAPMQDVARVLSDARTAFPPNAAAAAAGREAWFMGIHQEGPWISPTLAGAQSASHMSAPDDAALAFVRDNADVLRMITFSYHYPESDALLDTLLDSGIIPACGHDATIDARALQGFDRGLRHVTHLYSMTSSFQRVNGLKHLGTLEMALMTPGVAVEVIADGKHITEHFWRFIRHNKEPADIVIVSDSMRWAGMPEDPERVMKLGSVDVVVDEGVAWIADRTAFAGSVSSMHDMFRRLVREWGVPLEDAVRMTSTNQAAELGLGHSLGSIAPGMRADFVLMDEELNTTGVVKSGHLVPEPGPRG